MTIQARKRATNKKRAAQHDKNLLKQAAAEDGELAQAARTLLAAELRHLAGSLQRALGDIIEAHTEEDSQAFSLALRRVNSARVVLEGEASKLEVQT